MVLAKTATFTGVVVDGDKRGRLLGFPTANIAPAEGFLIPPDGIYACWVQIAPSDDILGATLSIGNNPTFSDVNDRRIEAHIHDLDANLYERTIRVWVVTPLRSMVRFRTLPELMESTARDVYRSREVLRELASSQRCSHTDASVNIVGPCGITPPGTYRRP